jgi:nitrate/nitrite-specific signal transduction histidine kinase
LIERFGHDYSSEWLRMAPVRFGVSDDGFGFIPTITEGKGMGLSIMCCRARTIGERSKFNRIRRPAR